MFGKKIKIIKKPSVEDIPKGIENPPKIIEGLDRIVLPINPLDVFELREEDYDLFKDRVNDLFYEKLIDEFKFYDKSPLHGWIKTNDLEHPYIFKGFTDEKTRLKNLMFISKNSVDYTELCKEDKPKFAFLNEKNSDNIYVIGLYIYTVSHKMDVYHPNPWNSRIREEKIFIKR